MLYTFRSVSRAIPMINDQNAPNKAELNRATFDVLRPEIIKLKAFMVRLHEERSSGWSEATATHRLLF
jgi:hypothetical protein